MKKLFLVLMLFVNVAAAEWYEGGTLHDSSFLEWEKATYENKLATCGDWVSGVYSRKKYRPEVMEELKAAGMDGIKKMAESCVVMLDITMDGLDKKEAANEKLSKVFTLGSVIAGWIEL